MRLKIDDDFLDMDDSVIAQTYAVNSIGDITTRQGGFSNNFTIPLTARNQGILGFPGDINSSSRNPYTKVTATLFDKGVPVADGYLRYQVVSDNKLEASFFADNTDWFTLIKDKKLTDLDLSDYDHTWDYTTIITAIAADKDSGYTYPLIDYGEFQARTDLEAVADQMFPALFVHTLVSQVFEDVGWKVDGDVASHPLYKRMILPFSGKAFAHSQEWAADNVYDDTDSGSFNFNQVGANIAWTTAGGTTITHNDENGFYKITVVADITPDAGGHEIAIQLDVNGVNITFLRTGTVSAQQEFVAIFENIRLLNGDSIIIECFTDDANNATLNSATISIEGELKAVFGSSIQMAPTMPDIKQSDFLKYLSQIFGIVFQANNMSKTVTMSFFKDIQGSDAVDWSDKIDMSRTREVDFTELLSNYAIQSVMTYKEDSNDKELAAYENETGLRLGRGQYDIANDHLDGIKTIYEAPFSPMININSFKNSIYIPQIKFKQAKFYTIDSVTNNGGNARLVLTSVASDIAVGDFIKVRETTSYDDFIDVLDVTDNKVTVNKSYVANETGFIQVDEDDLTPVPKVAILSENISVGTLTNSIHSTLRVTKDNTGALSSTTGNIPFCWFVKTQYVSDVDSLTDSLAFDQILLSNAIGDPLKDRFLREYELILNSMKYLKAYFHLTEVDISELDFTAPVYIQKFKAYFYISKIEKYQGSKRVTECELVKIG